MLFSAQGRMLKRLKWGRHEKSLRRENQGPRHNKMLVCGLILLILTIITEFSPFFTAQASAQTQQYSANTSVLTHTQVSTVNYTCSFTQFSPDGNPYALCPGPYPTGGNCVWWAWEQWHLLGLNLPTDWGNAADWAVDATQSGFALGLMPRVGSIAVFPVGDGAWAAGPAGHVAFVTSVSSDGESFNVTYQNFGDPTYLHVGVNYNVSVINEPQYQNGQLRFIYFPHALDPKLFATLPGINGNGSDPLASVTQANQALNNEQNSSSGTSASAASQHAKTYTSDRIALGLSPSSTDQEFNADFTGTGSNNLLLYNRKQGRIQIFKLDQQRAPARKYVWIDPDGIFHSTYQTPSSSPLVDLGDAIVPAGKWGSNLDIHVGNFSGGKASEILLYDRSAGSLQLLSLNTDYTIKQHKIISDVGTDWEIYVGRFDGQRSGLFMYKRFAYLPTTSDVSTPDPSTSTTVPGTTNSGVTSSSQATPTVSVQSKPTPTAIPTPKPTARAKATPTPRPTMTATATAMPTPAVTATPTVTPTAVPTPTPTATPTVAATSAAITSTVQAKAQVLSLQSSAIGAKAVVADTQQQITTDPTRNSDLSGSILQEWERKDRTANIMLLDFNADFSIRQQQQYTLWHDSWEVYVGRFDSAQQDGIFLYDRVAGEGRIMDFTNQLLVNNYQELHNLNENDVVYSGDFTASGRAQILFYDPNAGNIQILSFKKDLVLEGQKQQANIGTHQVLYVGYFGMSTLSIMLYDARNAQSTFIGFDRQLNITHQYLLKSWDQSWQILVGNFVDRTQCQDNTNCMAKDAILVLNRHTGQLECYVFTFGRQFSVYDNRIESFLRQGVPVQGGVDKVDMSSYSMVQSLNTSIRDEELY